MPKIYSTKFKKGSFTIGLGLAIAGVGLVASGIVGFYSGSIAITEKISEDRERISALEANKDNLEQWLKRVENKLDRVIEK